MAMANRSRNTYKCGSWTPALRAALATLLGVPTGHQQMLFTMVQERYRELLERGETSPVPSSKRWTMPWQHNRFWPKPNRHTRTSESADVQEDNYFFLNNRGDLSYTAFCLVG
jgi:hypothetical protein